MNGRLQITGSADSMTTTALLQSAGIIPTLTPEQILDIIINPQPGMLSDSEIAELCVLPDTYFHEAGFNQAMQNWRFNNQDVNIWPMSPAAAQKVEDEQARQREKFTMRVDGSVKQAFTPMIENFVPEQVKLVEDAQKISFGLSSYGYDVRLSDEVIDGKQPFVIFTNHNTHLVDPKRPNPDRYTTPLEILTDDDGAKYVIMPAHSYGMGFTIEKFNIPRDVSIICVGKSTYARATVFVNVTPIEAGFSGSVVIELANGSGCPVKIYLNEGIAQFVFFRGRRPCKTSYADRKGKYQGQRGVVHSKV